MKNTTKIITSLASRKVRSYVEAMDISPVLSFHHERKIRRFIELAENKDARMEEQVGFRRLAHNNDN